MSFGIEEAPIQWKDIDWTQSIKDIAHQLGCSVAIVKRAKKKLEAGEDIGEYTKQEPIIMLPVNEKSNIDWTLSSRTIAKILHISSSYAYLLKKKWCKKLNLPAQLTYKETLKPHLKEIDWKQKDEVIAKKYGVSHKTVRKMRTRMNIPAYHMFQYGKGRNACMSVDIRRRVYTTAYDKLADTLKKAPSGTTITDVIVGLIEKYL